MAMRMPQNMYILADPPYYQQENRLYAYMQGLLEVGNVISSATD